LDFAVSVLGRGKGLIDLLYIIIYNKLIYNIYINNIDVLKLPFPLFSELSTRQRGKLEKTK
jgi:hypothetical protein